MTETPPDTETNAERLTTDTSIDRRHYLQAATAAGIVGLAGCTGDDGTADATGVLSTQVTDQPGDIADFESCVVTIDGIWIKPAETDDDGDETENQENDTEDAADESAAREYHPFEEPQTADLVELQDETTELIDQRELATDTYQFLQLDVSDVDGVLDGGDGTEVDTPGNAPLQFNQNFEIRDDERTVFTADFTPVRQGQTGQYLLQPVADGTTVRYEPIEDESDTDDEGSDADGDGEDTNGD